MIGTGEITADSMFMGRGRGAWRLLRNVGPNIALCCVALAGIAAGLIAARLGNQDAATWIWALASLPVLIALLFQIVRALPRGEIGLDILAAISMITAILLREPLAGTVIALMYAGGQLLERYAEGRAERDMTALLGRVPTTATRYAGGGLEQISIGAVRPDDRLLIRHGEVVPVDGVVATTSATLDESALTGEALPVRRTAGEEVLSGSTLVGPAFDLTVRKPAAESTYANIVRLVEKARRSRAPMTRLADRYALGFLVLSLGLAGSSWLISGDAQRFLAVLVIATPCPLILAVPVAIIAGMSRAARSGALLKNGGAMESLALVKVAVLDKTGTLTQGQARVRSIESFAGWDSDQILSLAASLDQASRHVVAEALVAEARRRSLSLQAPHGVEESPGDGITGQVGSRAVAVGGRRFVAERCDLSNATSRGTSVAPAGLLVHVGIDGQLAGIIVMSDELRGDASHVLDEMRSAGITRIILASGDKQEVAEAAGLALGVDEILYELTPSSKVQVIQAERSRGPVMMVGDGVNDAPALATADVGVAMGARGAAASSEAASVVILVDQLEPLGRALRIAKRTRRIALQSVFAGLGLSLGGMLLASLGWIAPVPGALLQEGIDVAVILNALRVLR